MKFHIINGEGPFSPFALCGRTSSYTINPQFSPVIITLIYYSTLGLWGLDWSPNYSVGIFRVNPVVFCSLFPTHLTHLFWIPRYTAWGIGTNIYYRVTATRFESVYLASLQQGAMSGNFILPGMVMLCPSGGWLSFGLCLCVCVW